MPFPAHPMTGEQFAAIRELFGMGRREFATLLGYTGEARTNWLVMKRYETGDREISPLIARLVTMLKWYYDLNGDFPDFTNDERGLRHG